MARESDRLEGNLLIETVSLLVQRQHETEGWVAEQARQAEERAAEAERRYAELEVRLADIEQHLDRLLHEVEPSESEAPLDQRLARLREQLKDLKSGASVRPGERAAIAEAAPTSVDAPTPVASLEALFARFLVWLGSSSQDRIGVGLMAIGAAAVLYVAYALLTQLRF